ncbi:MAG: hypothetical protein ABI678_08050 [Kofleriaceae bacterium]
MKRLLIVTLAACGNDAAKSADAAIDVAIPDAIPDALLDAPAAPANAHRYVIDHELMPTNNNLARMYALDLDNSGQVDNQLGMVVAAFSSMGFDVQAPMDHAIDTGATIMLADVESATLTGGAATFTLFQGSNAMPAPCSGASDTTCRHHLAGTATFDVAATSPHDPPLPGTITGGVLDAGPGTLHLTTTIFGAPLSLQLIGTRVRWTQPTDSVLMTGVIDGGIPTSELHTTVYPAMQTAITAQIALDCTALASPPQCGCAAGSTGKTDIDLFDTNHDCAVTVDELEASSLLQSLLASDVTIDNQPAVSFGVGISAVHAAFVPPT